MSSPANTGSTLPAVPELTDEQRHAVHRQACWLVACASQGYAAEYEDDSLAGAADLPTLGCFVTLKRCGRLRACCGSLGRDMPLRRALAEAAIATATRDRRLPTISAIELSCLDLEVSVLHNLQPVEAVGEARRDAVEIGKHGLQIARGGERGLLLPSVATEHGLDADGFLRQVCLKAGLPPTAWKDADTQLWTYEGVVFGEPFQVGMLAAWDLRSQPLFTAEQIRELAAVARDNVVSLAKGATPTYFVPSLPDGNVNGVTLTLRMPDRDRPAQFGKLGLRPELPVQSTVAELCRMATGLFQMGGISSEQLEQLQVDVTVLHDTAMHGTVDEPDLRGFEPAHRALLVTQQNRSCWVLEPDLAAEEVLQAAADSAEIRRRELASVYSLEAASSVTPVRHANVPRAVARTGARPPAVAGLFYPGEQAELERTVDALFPAEPSPRQAWRGALLPHAGLQYSGRIAAAVLDRIEIPETVIIVGPKHTRLGVEWAVAPCTAWQLPGITLASDVELATELAENIPDLELDSQAHLREHAIEVELPLLARRAPGAKVVGIAIGAADREACQEFAAALAEVLRPRAERTLLIVSSDMNHFASDQENRRLDEMALACLDRLDPTALYQTVRENHISMCGVLPAVIVLETLQKLQPLQTCQRVAYATTADTTGDTSRVVGYAGMLFN